MNFSELCDPESASLGRRDYNATPSPECAVCSAWVHPEDDDARACERCGQAIHIDCGLPFEDGTYTCVPCGALLAEEEAVSA